MATDVLRLSTVLLVLVCSNSSVYGHSRHPEKLIELYEIIGDIGRDSLFRLKFKNPKGNIWFMRYAAACWVMFLFLESWLNSKVYISINS